VRIVLAIAFGATVGASIPACARVLGPTADVTYAAPDDGAGNDVAMRDASGDGPPLEAGPITFQQVAADDSHQGTVGQLTFPMPIRAHSAIVVAARIGPF
jgi:hypothetical protein